MIKGYFGLPGSGKTYALAWIGLSAMRKKIQVYSNFPLKGAYRLLSLDDVVYIPEGSYVLLDEIQAWASSRQWSKFGHKNYLLFSQHRKRGLQMFLTSQYPKRIDKSIRELIHYYVWSVDKGIAFVYQIFSDIHDVVVESKKNMRISILPKLKSVYSSYNHLFSINLEREDGTKEFEQWDLIC